MYEHHLCFLHSVEVKPSSLTDKWTNQEAEEEWNGMNDKCVYPNNIVTLLSASSVKIFFNVSIGCD